ncbi:MAG: transposase [Ethanoligenens sp.]
MKDATPLNTPKNTTILSSVRAGGTTVHQYFAGALNGKLFLKYIQEFLAPSLHDGGLVIMDNLRCHKVDGVREAIKNPVQHFFIFPL